MTKDNYPEILKSTSNGKTLDGANCRLNTEETIGEFENSNNNSR